MKEKKVKVIITALLLLGLIVVSVFFHPEISSSEPDNEIDALNNSNVETGPGATNNINGQNVLISLEKPPETVIGG